MAETALAKLAEKHNGRFTGITRKLYDKYLSSERARARIKQATEETVEAVVDSTVTLGTTFLFAGLQGAYWDNKDKNGKPTYGVKIGPVPLDLGAGAVMHLLAVLGMGGKMNRQLRNAGNGAMASYVASWARGIGFKWAKDRKAGGGAPATRGSLADDVANMLAT